MKKLSSTFFMFILIFGIASCGSNIDLVTESPPPPSGGGGDRGAEVFGGTALKSSGGAIGGYLVQIAGQYGDPDSHNLTALAYSADGNLLHVYLQTGKIVRQSVYYSERDCQQGTALITSDPLINKIVRSGDGTFFKMVDYIKIKPLSAMQDDGTCFNNDTWSEMWLGEMRQIEPVADLSECAPLGLNLF